MGGGWGVEEAHLEHGVLARSPPGVQPRGPEDVGDVEGCVVAVVSNPSELLTRTWDNALLFHKSSKNIQMTHYCGEVPQVFTLEGVSPPTRG